MRHRSGTILGDHAVVHILVRRHTALTTEVLIVLIVAAETNVDRPVVVRHPAQRGRKRLKIGRTAVLIERAVVEPTVRRLVRGAEAGVNRVAQRDVEHATQVLLAVLTDARDDIGAELRLRLRGDDIDRAARRVLAEQRTLRSAQHLDTLDVDRRHHLPDRIRHVMAVQIEARAGRRQCDRTIVADTADVHRLDVATIGRRERQIRHALADVCDVVDALRLHGIGADGRYRHRQVLEALLTAASRDDDLFEHRGSCSGLRLRGALQGYRKQNPRCYPRNTKRRIPNTHFLIPLIIIELDGSPDSRYEPSEQRKHRCVAPHKKVRLEICLRLA